MASNGIKQGAEALRARIEGLAARMSERERRLVGLLAVVGLALGAFQAFSWNAAQRDREVAAVSELALRRQGQALVARKALDGAERGRLAAISSRGIAAPNLWIARVRIEQRLAAAAALAGIKDPDIQVAAALEPGPLPLLRAEIAGPYVKPAFVSLLKAAVTADPAALVDRVQIQAAGDPEFKLALVYAVALDAGESRP